MKVSIIIPTLNRANTLALTLSSIYALPSLDGVEVIVVDNGSSDDTAGVCHGYTCREPALNYIYDAEPGLLTGRHLGASVSTGDVLCFLDDDVKLTPSWLSGVKGAFNDPGVQLATGPCLPEYEVTPPLWLKYFWQKAPSKGKICTWLSLMDLGPDIKNVHPNYIWGLNFCIRKKALLQLGGFHPDCIPPHLQMFQGDGETGL